ncbi:nucleotide diphosphatase KNAG_0H03460 [Huiozyma naganishii CBS 8797]|uniref:Maf-like protein n=1 Tax=Huiozyma naganishii (strain ATCC MYA-139 / BCRC 22969 / CBS 8797 / KCTC 17520 / NBRC 10181 / NCYC 3082 / Yp74L-3) TaxID=1071383 RepID=J7RA57_HUIN7|nr:hypothetical protein KNAG_0H03460 [Kazachstania naganishii CBS 8797]CCK71760.1 hypothetical protein KNAG_0H03460 [Kazachstania naganishii CBS 8797]
MLGTGSEYQVILASSSPRRYEILSDNIGIRNLQTTVPSFEENLDKRLYVGRPLDYVRDTARGKASSIVADLASGRLESLQGSSSGALIVCADTVVIGPDGQVYEKPGTRERQLQYLHRFCYESAGRPVVVATAVAIVKWPCGGTMKEHSVHTFEETTEVYFDGTTPRDVIEAYVSSGDGLQVAGGFKIQGPGGVLIKRINGDYYTVVGLPLNATFRALLALQR